MFSGAAVDEERRNASASATLAASAAAAQLKDAAKAAEAKAASAVADARDEAHAKYMQSHAVPAVEELAQSLPLEERRNAMCIIASCLAPQWQLATLAAGIEARRCARETSGVCVVCVCRGVAGCAAGPVVTMTQ